MDILYLLALILTFSFICPFSFRVFSILATPLVKYGRDLKLLKDSSIEQSCEKSLSVADQVSKLWRLDTFLSNNLVVKKDPLKATHKQLKNENTKQLLDKVFVISGIIKVEVNVISRSRSLRLITLSETLIIPDIAKTESNNCFILYIVLKKATTNALLKIAIRREMFLLRCVRDATQHSGN